MVRADGNQLHDISIPLRFNGPQPNAFGAEKASAHALGDTRLGASVNFETYTFTPHCSGTHTECVGHITDERISIRDRLTDILITALCISVRPANAANGDLVIERSEIEKNLSSHAGNGLKFEALVIRTIPNDLSKLDRVYDDASITPYLTADAMRSIIDAGVRHLLVDLPSIDRMDDGGKLENHRLFWNIASGSRSVSRDTRINSTITELIYVPDNVSDGEYLLNIQIAPFASDCAPSRPILIGMSA